MTLKWNFCRGGVQFKKPSVGGEGGVRVCGDAVLHYFWCGFAVIFTLTRSIAVSKHYVACGYYNLSFAVFGEKSVCGDDTL